MSDKQSAGARKRKTSNNKRPQQAEALATNGVEKKPLLSNFWVRTITTVGMILPFLALNYYGQLPAIALVLFLELSVFREVMRIASVYRINKQIPGFGLLPWAFLSVALLWLFSRALRRLLTKSWPELDPILRHITFICFILYVIAFMSFVASLKAGMYTYQMGQFAWTHMALFFITGQATLMVNNMLNGMFWFLLPVSLIIANDVWAYCCGKAFGKHPLIKLSPKKTWEGFIGGGICTFAWGLFFSWLLSRWDRLVCPKEDFFEVPSCDPLHVFLPREYDVPRILQALAGLLGVSWETISIRPVMLHSLSFSAFASIVAPFGGFFASGVKRAFKLKDFGDLIPGHGGVTDRMDCQLLMSTFTYVYLTNFIRPSGGVCSSYGLIIHCVRRLPMKDQVRLFNTLASLMGVNVTVPHNFGA